MHHFQGKHLTSLSRANLQANSDCIQTSSCWCSGVSLIPKYLRIFFLLMTLFFRKSFVKHLLNMIYRMSLGLGNLPVMIRGACVKVCRMLLQGCMRLRQNSRQLESKVSNSCIEHICKRLYLESEVSNWEVLYSDSGLNMCASKQRQMFVHRAQQWKKI